MARLSAWRGGASPRPYVCGGLLGEYHNADVKENQRAREPENQEGCSHFRVPSSHCPCPLLPVPCPLYTTPMLILGVDTGGTFTDFYLIADDSLSAGGGAAVTVYKRPSIPDDPAQAILKGLAEILPTSNLQPPATPDMGGTSTDVSLCPGRIIERDEMHVGELPIRGLTVDVLSVGARALRPDPHRRQALPRRADGAAAGAFAEGAGTARQLRGSGSQP